MGEWRRPKGQRKRESDRWGPSSSKNRNWSHGKPPRFPEEMQWEQKFCQTNGVRWEKLIETKKYLHQYSDITSWDDSAGKEAFDNAKARYWAQINGLQPEITLPDPDMFIDTVDHDAPLSNLKLYQNIHGSLSEDEADNVNDWSGDEWGVGGVILLDSHYEKKEEEVVWDNIATGWGDDHPIHPTGWGDIPIQSNVQSDAWGVVQNNWIDNSVNPTGWGAIAAEPNNAGARYEGIVPMGWGDMAAEPSAAGTRYEGIVPTGWGDIEGPKYPWNGGVTSANYWSYGYEPGVSAEAGQYWNHNCDRYPNGTWGSYNRNYPEDRRYRGGQHGAKKNGSTNYKGKQWRKKEGGSRPFCAPLTSKDTWNVPSSVA